MLTALWQTLANINLVGFTGRKYDEGVPVEDVKKRLKSTPFSLYGWQACSIHVYIPMCVLHARMTCMCTCATALPPLPPPMRARRRSRASTSGAATADCVGSQFRCTNSYAPST